ncbi:hypothetical protein PanWU01x14_333330 [Parasponia andersonii]|uniref:Uncharacterized protein n=1 Tax=Parasponia andersonii TaxID=3476 RepID=A0A2P5AH08_PARAD|nr:hypothetical protein PanWU01x14_333330 [Parasponia andersonii]
MSGQIHTRHLVLGRDPKQLELMQHKEEWAHGRANPPEYHENLDQVGHKELPSSAHEEPVRTTRFIRVHFVHVLLRREQRREYDPPRAAPAVELRRLQRVVEPRPLGERVAGDKHHGGDEPAYDRRPRLHHRASGGYCREPTKEPVADVGDVPVAGEYPLPEKRRQCRRAPGERGSHGGSTDGAPLPVVPSGVVRA